MNERVKELFDLRDIIEELNRENQITNQEKQVLEHNVQSIKRYSVDLYCLIHTPCENLPSFSKHHSGTLVQWLSLSQLHSATSKI